MKLLRTPDVQFANLPDYAFAPHFANVVDPDTGDESIRMHYIDEGQGPVVVLLHGEPSWSYLYRKMITGLRGNHRVIAPDLVGFGKSDKPAQRTDHTYARHVEWMRQLLFDHLNLTDITVFVQDWGGLIGLRLVAEHPDRFLGVIAGNTGLNRGDRPPTEGFLKWREFSQRVEQFPVGFIVNGGCQRDLTSEEVAAYDAPFPDESFKEGARQMPTLVPASPDDPAAADNDRAWQSLEKFTKPFLTTFSDSDPVTKGGERAFQFKVPGAQDQPHRIMEGAGHFLQEDCPDELVAIITEFINRY